MATVVTSIAGVSLAVPMLLTSQRDGDLKFIWTEPAAMDISIGGAGKNPARDPPSSSWRKGYMAHFDELTLVHEELYRLVPARCQRMNEVRLSRMSARHEARK
jgi:hypothetical protein